MSSSTAILTLGIDHPLSGKLKRGFSADVRIICSNGGGHTATWGKVKFRKLRTHGIREKLVGAGICLKIDSGCLHQAASEAAFWEYISRQPERVYFPPQLGWGTCEGCGQGWAAYPELKPDNDDYDRPEFIVALANNIANTFDIEDWRIEQWGIHKGRLCIYDYGVNNIEREDDY